jgi:hypothetical protein
MTFIPTGALILNKGAFAQCTGSAYGRMCAFIEENSLGTYLYRSISVYFTHGAALECLVHQVVLVVCGNYSVDGINYCECSTDAHPVIWMYVQARMSISMANFKSSLGF